MTFLLVGQFGRGLFAQRCASLARVGDVRTVNTRAQRRPVNAPGSVGYLEAFFSRSSTNFSIFLIFEE
jgi:hypothetical protein